MREDEGKVPDDFPQMRMRARLGSKGGAPYKPYYRAREVWKWFRDSNNSRKDENG